MDDAEILKAFLDRDEAAIEKAEHAYGSYCTTVARNILAAPEDIEEVLSDTWLRAWSAIPPQKPDNLKLYFARITRNLAYDKFRAQCRSKRGAGETALALHELSECIPSPGQPGDALEARELAQTVNDFLAALPQRERTIFLLRYFYAEPAADIARRCGTGTALVRTSLSRTRKKLKNHLKKTC